MAFMANSCKAIDLPPSGSLKFTGGTNVGIKTILRGLGTLVLRFPASVSINNPKRVNEIYITSPQSLSVWLNSALFKHRNQER